MTLYKDNYQIWTVSKLLAQTNLSIPKYQRPYKWTQKNIHVLFQDIENSIDKSEYRLGSVVFCKNQENGHTTQEIVDGQQRTLTLLLAVKVLIDTRLETLESKRLKEQILDLKPPIWAFMERQNFTADISKFNLHQNYQTLTHILNQPEFTETHIEFLLTKCTVATFVLDDISEAFQFFDSQNARGKDLEPHDLLKAFHLREFASNETSLKAEAVAHWESLSSAELAKLFGVYLYRIKQWCDKQRAYNFSKSKIDIFKGITLEHSAQRPYTALLRTAHYYVEDYNQNFHRKIDHASMAFPFQLDQCIINGRRFFEMVTHYHTLIRRLTAPITSPEGYITHSLFKNNTLSQQAQNILQTLATYPEKHRDGDIYTRYLFECALLFYLDKFGKEELSRIIEKLFLWAYTCRLTLQRISIASIDKYADENNIFYAIRKARTPSDVMAYPIKTLDSNNNAALDAAPQKLVQLFKEMHYCA